MRAVAVWVLVLGGLFGLASCGGDDGGSTAADADSAAPTPAPDDQPSDPDQGAAPVASGDGGSFTVDGTSFEAAVFRCELEEDFYGDMPDPGDLDLVARAGDGGLTIDLIHRDDGRGPSGQVFDQEIHELRLNLNGEEYSNRAADNFEGDWFLGGVPTLGDQTPGEPLGAAPFTVAGSRFTGSMTLRQDFPEGGTATTDVAFDLEIPASTLPC